MSQALSIQVQQAVTPDPAASATGGARASAGQGAPGSAASFSKILKDHTVNAESDGTGRSLETGRPDDAGETHAAVTGFPGGNDLPPLRPLPLVFATARAVGRLSEQAGEHLDLGSEELSALLAAPSVGDPAAVPNGRAGPALAAPLQPVQVPSADLIPAAGSAALADGVAPTAVSADSAAASPVILTHIASDAVALQTATIARGPLGESATATSTGALGSANRGDVPGQLTAALLQTGLAGDGPDSGVTGQTAARDALAQSADAGESSTDELFARLLSRSAESSATTPTPAGTQSSNVPPPLTVSATAGSLGGGASPTPAALPNAIDVPVSDPQWGRALGERVLWSVGTQQSSAQIRLNPPELGPIEIRIHVNQDQANISFNSSHQSVREAVEAALPRLREMLAGEGLQLADVDVSDGRSSQQRAATDDGDSQGQSRAHTGAGAEHDGAAVEARGVRVTSGLVDYYA